MPDISQSLKDTVVGKITMHNDKQNLDTQCTGLYSILHWTWVGK